MTPIVGYTDRGSVAPGEVINCHVSLLSDSDGAEAEYRVSLVRVTGVSDAGTAERIEPVPSAVDGNRVARIHNTSVGSHGTAAVHLAGGDDSGLTLQVSFMPTLFGGSDQALLSLREAYSGGFEELTLGLDAARRPIILIGGSRSGVRRFELSDPLVEEQWYRLSGGFNRSEAFLEVTLLGEDEPAVTRSAWSFSPPPELTSPTAAFACRATTESNGLRPVDMFTGRLEHPLVARSSISAADRARYARPGVSALPCGSDVIALWDLGLKMNTFNVQDVSGNGNHGHLFGLPMRAVTGSNWDRRSTSVHETPDQYRAVHFFGDAIEDAGWPPAFSLRIPADLRSGLYAFALKSRDEVDTIPFVVPPSSPQADLLLLLPTATYMAYSNARFTWEKVNWEVQRERTVELGRCEQILLDHPELGASSYDQYLDGSNVAYISWLRPNLDMRADQKRYENYPCDLHLINWLEDRRYRYEVATDGDLDRAGIGLLDRYRVVVTGTHPEYVSTRCCAALESFVSAGGRLAVLGGNAFHYLVAFSSERPWIMEVRKPDNRPLGSRAAAEGHMGLTGEFSGDPDGPRPSERFLGTSTASMGFDEPRPYQRLPDSDDPRAAFIFAGVSDRVIGDGGIFGGAVFQEWDNTEDVSDAALEAVRPMVLARSTGHSVNTRWFGATKRRNHAEMTYFTTQRGGAVFSAASMGWCLCLRTADVARVTANVLDRFLDPAPFDSPVQEG